MIKTFFKIAVRSLRRNKSYSLINVLGLSVGIAFTVLLFSWVLNELNTDMFHEDSSSIHLVTMEYEYPNKVVKSSLLSYPIAPILLEENPEIEGYTRFLKVTMPLNVKVGENVFHERLSACTDSEFFNFFSFKTLTGNFDEALTSASDVVISETTAKKYFGDENPLGKNILVQNEYSLVVRGVFQDLPENSQFNFDIAFSYNFVEEFNPHCFEWSNSGTNTWVKLSENADVKALSAKIKDTVGRHLNYYNQTLQLIPLNDYYFAHGYDMAYTRKGNMHYVILLSIVALFILIVAIVNYVNLFTAMSTRRYKEVGLKKTLGANSSTVSSQFIVESFVLVIFSVLLSLLMFFILLPVFEHLTNSHIVLTNLITPMLLLYLSVIVIVTVLGGLYPSFTLSSKPILDVLKDPSKAFAGKLSLEKSLVIVQFSIAVFMIIGTIVVHKQMDYMMIKNLGFDKECVMTIKSNTELSKDYLQFKESMRSSNSIDLVSCIGIYPSHADNKTAQIWWEGKDQIQDFEIAYSYVDMDFIKLMGIKIAHGRDFDPDLQSDYQNAFIINEQAKEMMGLDNAVDYPFSFEGQKGKIVGVVANPQFQSLHNAAKPRLFIPIESTDEMPKIRSGGVILIRSKLGEFQQAEKEIQDWCGTHNISVAPDIHFLDDTYVLMYMKERRIARIFSLFSVLSIIISCMGIFILNSFYTKKKSKEIAVRKINGAEISDIYKEVLLYLVKWISASILLAVPVSVILLNRWLENFAYKTTLSWWIFALAGVLALGIALLTVSWQSWRAATRNPVEALRYE